MYNEIELLGNIVEDDNSFCTKGHISTYQKTLSNYYMSKVKKTIVEN
jgi:hypothetical protein